MPQAHVAAGRQATCRGLTSPDTDLVGGALVVEKTTVATTGEDRAIVMTRVVMIHRIAILILFESNFIWPEHIINSQRHISLSI